MLKKCVTQLFHITKRQFKQKVQLPIRKKQPSTTDNLKAYLKTRQNCTYQEWKSTRCEFLNNDTFWRDINLTNIDALTLTVCYLLKNYKLGTSYLNFLKQEGIEPNLATLGKILKLLAAKSWDNGLSQDEESQIIEIYEKIQKSYPILDPLTLDSLIQALAVTKDWQKCLDLANDLKIVAPIGPFAFSSLVAGAFLNNNEKLAWKLLTEMLEEDKPPAKPVYLAFLKNVNDKGEFLQKTEEMFGFLHKNYVKIDREIAGKICEFAKKFDIPAKISPITPKGICQTCGSKLEKFEVTDEEFSLLKSKVFENVLIGRDVFTKTNPEEVKQFQDFIQKEPNYDVVIDGLNVAFTTNSKDPSVRSLILKTVVSHFVSLNRKVLVLGRKHMTGWPKNNWNYVAHNSTVFLTENISEDDPYLLYCALNSGKNTIIVSRDLMRSHRFLLKNYHLRVIFDKWLKQRRWEFLRLNETRKAVFIKPLPFLDLAQKSGPFWHVPIDDSSFLCVKLN